MDHMKGYQERNRRRRDARRRRKSGKRGSSGQSTLGSSVMSYRELSKWREESYGSGRFRDPKIIAGAASALVVLLILIVVLVYPFGGSKKDEGESVASGESVVEQETPQAVEGEKIEVAKQVAAVPKLSPDSISIPTPGPRSKAVALTFDDGPSTVNTPKVLAHLKKYNAHATFFIVGNRAAAGKDVLKAELAQGCEIANHSWDHSNLSKMRMRQVNKQYDKTKNLVKKLTGFEITLLRPPYGAVSDSMRKKLKHPMILWSLDTLDWKSRNAKAVYKRVKKSVHDGDIILMHDIHPSTADSLPKVLSWLVKKDFDILTVSELMQRKGVKPKNGTAYGQCS